MPPKAPKPPEPDLHEVDDELEIEDEEDEDDDDEDEEEIEEGEDEEDGEDEEEEDLDEVGPHDHHIAIAMIEAAAHITASAVSASDKDYIEEPDKVLDFMRAIYNGLAEF